LFSIVAITRFFILWLFASVCLSVLLQQALVRLLVSLFF